MKPCINLTTKYELFFECIFCVCMTMMIVFVLKNTAALLINEKVKDLEKSMCVRLVLFYLGPWTEAGFE